jgi:hypothetical protein
MCHFSWHAFKIFFLFLIFCNSVMAFLNVGFFEFILYGIYSASWILGTLPNWGDSSHHFFQNFFSPSSFSFPSGILIEFLDLRPFVIAPKVAEVPQVYFLFFKLSNSYNFLQTTDAFLCPFCCLAYPLKGFCLFILFPLYFLL